MTAAFKYLLTVNGQPKSQAFERKDLKPTRQEGDFEDMEIMVNGISFGARLELGFKSQPYSSPAV